MIAIIDYGMGNLSSVEKAFKYIGCQVKVTNNPDIVNEANGVVLPGVGAFADAVKNLHNASMVKTIKDVIGRGVPFLGICLGMQLLLDWSEEGGIDNKGLGLIKGVVKRLPSDMGLKVPHMGWNSIKMNKECPLFKDMPDDSYVYFVHSYYACIDDRNAAAASAYYGMEFDVAIGYGNIFATQFHPEKSGNIGLKILRNFADIVAKR